MMKRLPNARSRRGLSMVEAALALPIFFALLFGMLEYSWAFLKSQQIHNAARHGARNGIVFGATAAEVQAAVDQVMADSGLDSSGYTTTLIPPDPGTLTSGQILEVRVSVDYGNIELIGIPLIPTPASLTGSTSMAREAPK